MDKKKKHFFSSCIICVFYKLAVNINVSKRYIIQWSKALSENVGVYHHTEKTKEKRPQYPVYFKPLNP